MPNRIIRESICSSPTLAGLSDGAERLFYRLLTRTDDFGAFKADAEIVRGECMPLVGKSAAEVGKLIAELEAAGLVSLYSIKDRTFGEFVTWSDHNKPRSKSRKYPERLPDDSICKHVQADASTRKHMLTYTESESESKTYNSETPARKRAAVALDLDSPGWRLADLWRDLLLAYQPDHKISTVKNWAKSSNRQKWAVDFDRICRIDGREPARVARVARWLWEESADWASGSSWRAVCQAPAKYREKFDTLSAQESGGEGRKPQQARTYAPLVR
jgi:hypothetical protein